VAGGSTSRTQDMVDNLKILLAVAWFTEPGQTFFAFGRESWTETKKVVWPTRKEATQTTAAVFGFVVIMAVFLWISDKSLEWVLYDLILGWKKS